MATEKRLIDANAGISKLEDELHMCKPVSMDDGYLEAYKKAVIPRLLRNVIDWLKTQPTVDAVEVVHGQWFVIEDDYFDLVELKCSVCGESWGFEDYEDCIPQNYHYCPNCGAKMDADKEATP